MEAQAHTFQSGVFNQFAFDQLMKQLSHVPGLAKIGLKPQAIAQLACQTSPYTAFITHLPLTSRPGQSKQIVDIEYWHGQINTYLTLLQQEWNNLKIEGQANHQTESNIDEQQWLAFNYAVYDYADLMLDIILDAWQIYSTEFSQFLDCPEVDPILQIKQWYQAWWRCFDRVYRQYMLQSRFAKCYAQLINCALDCTAARK